MPLRPLPVYANPPVVEIVAAAQFAPLPQFALEQIVTLAREFEDWGVVDAPPAIPPMFEPPPGQVTPTALNFNLGAPPLRLVLSADAGRWTAQLQQDRLAVHEHRTTDRPSFAHVETKLLEVADGSRRTLGRALLGDELWGRQS